MSAPSTVRIAKPDDYQEVWRLFLTGHRENGIFTLSPNKVNWILNRILCPEQIPLGDTGVRGTIGVIGPIGSIEGLVLLTLGTYWYSEDLHLEEFLVLVDPEHRKTGHAQALVQWMKNQVEITQLPLITGIISNIRTEAKCRLYRRMLPKIGEFFCLTPKGSTLTPGLVAVSS
jgi:GNAT superfamily N-acetyltransferase